MKGLLLVLFMLVPASSSFAEIRTVRIVFTPCLRGACLADATNAVKDAKIGVVGKLKVIHLDDGLASFTRDPKTLPQIQETGLDLYVGTRAYSTPVRPVRSMHIAVRC